MQATDTSRRGRALRELPGPARAWPPSETSVIAQAGQRADRDDATPLRRLRRRPGQEVEHPAAVFLLPGLDGVEVSLDQGFADEIARSATGTGRKVECTQRLPVRP